MTMSTTDTTDTAVTMTTETNGVIINVGVRIDAVQGKIDGFTFLD